MEITKLILSKIKFNLREFENAENKIEAIYFLKEILFILKKEESKDSRIKNFLDQVQSELNFELGKTNWRKIKLNFPEIGYCYSVDKYLFLKKELQTTSIANSCTVWEYVQKQIPVVCDFYETMFTQKVPLFVL